MKTPPFPKTIFSATALFLLAAHCFAHPDSEHVSSEASAYPELRLVTGNGENRFEANMSWTHFPDTNTVGPTHGGIAVSRSQRVFVSTDGERGICEFTQDGKFVQSIAPELSGVHSLTLHEESGVEYLYGAHLQGERVVKLDLDGGLHLAISSSEAAPVPGGLKGVTAVAVSDDGRIFVAAGYGSNLIHVFDAQGNRLQTFGGKGAEDGLTNTCHGLAIDRRFEPNRLLVVDRENRRLAHYTLDGEFIATHAVGLRRPCAVSFFGDLSAVAELEGRVTLLNKDGHPIAFLGDNPLRGQWAKFNTPLEKIPDAAFTAPHGLAFDQEGNLYVQDWNESGRISKLTRKQE